MEIEFGKFLDTVPERELLSEREILLMQSAWFKSATTLLKFQRGA